MGVYTIESDAGPFLSEDPSFPDRQAARLYHEQSAAAQAIAETSDPSMWRVTPVSDLESWLDSLLAYDVTYVVEVLGPAPSVTRTTAGWLLMLRAQNSGKELPKRQP